MSSNSFRNKVYHKQLAKESYICLNIGGAHGVMVIVVGNGHSHTSSNPGRDWLHFT